jgi:signal transduction histidine kinase
VLGDEEALRDLVRREVLVEEQKHLDLAGGERARDRLGNAVEPSALADAVEKPARDATRECRLAADDATEEGRDLLGGLGLEQVAGCSAPDRRKQVLLGVRCCEHDDLGVRRLLADARERGETVHPRHREIEEHEIGLQAARFLDRLLPAIGVADDREALLGEERGQRIPGEGMVVDEQDSLGHDPLIGRRPYADKREMEHLRSQSYRSWAVGELILFALLGTGTVLFAVSGSLQSAYELPETRLVLDTAVAVVAGLVAVLASVRFRVDGRALDLLLAAGFWSISLGTTAFGLVPVLDGDPLPPWAAWSLVGARLLGAALIAIAPWWNARIAQRQQALVIVGFGIAAILASAAFGLRTPVWEEGGAGVTLVEGPSVKRAAALLAMLWLVALIGFAVRYRRHGRDLDSWMCLSATLAFFAELHLLLTPVVSSELVLQGDFLRLVAYGVLVVGVWRAITDAEFGRAVADERARVAREIHDGLAQYLFAITAQVSMLESGASLDEVLPRLKRASVAAQQEARFAVLALSSAGGSARFDSALRRYVDVLTADGEVDVELDVDGSVRLAPDEQIEIFRIVQEGLGNARRHAGARHVEVAISNQAGRRVVSVRDDGVGFDEETVTSGQGFANMHQRAEAIEGRLSMRSTPGRGTAIEVVLRAT